MIGHQKIWNFFTQSAQKDKLAHAYLLTGPAGIGKRTLALELAAWLICEEKKDNIFEPCGQCRCCLEIFKNQHPDLFLVEPPQEEKNNTVKTLEIGISQVKEAQHRLSLFPYSSKYKIVIIDGAEKMTREAANSFLKTLEEPRGKSLIILISAYSQVILPTIVSRCQQIKFLLVRETEILAGLGKIFQNKPEIKRAAKLAAGRPGLAVNLLEKSGAMAGYEKNAEVFKKILKTDLIWRFDFVRQLSQNAALAREFLSQWLLWLRDRLLENSGCSDLAIQNLPTPISYSRGDLIDLMEEIQKTDNILGNASFNSRLALENLMIKF